MKKHKNSRNNLIEHIQIQLEKIEKDDVAVCYYDREVLDEDDINFLIKTISQIVPYENSVIALPRVTSLVGLTIKELEMYKKYIQKAIDSRREKDAEGEY